MWILDRTYNLGFWGLPYPYWVSTKKTIFIPPIKNVMPKKEGFDKHEGRGQEF